VSEGEPVTCEEATKTAWQVHSVLAEWTRTVDAKASFALAMESAALAGVAALSGSGHRLGSVSGALPKTALWTGLALDRLVHHAEVYSLKGESYRMRGREIGRIPAGNSNN
jgi:hypothetical protein